MAINLSYYLVYSGASLKHSEHSDIDLIFDKHATYIAIITIEIRQTRPRHRVTKRQISVTFAVKVCRTLRDTIINTTVVVFYQAESSTLTWFGAWTLGPERSGSTPKCPAAGSSTAWWPPKDVSTVWEVRTRGDTQVCKTAQ